MFQKLRSTLSITAMGIAAISMTSCNQEPTACFTLDKTTAQVNTPITANAACSTDAEAYLWKGDGPITLSAGGTSSSIIEYTFSESGTFSISLEVQNGSKTDVTSQTVTITE